MSSRLIKLLSQYIVFDFIEMTNFLEKTEEFLFPGCLWTKICEGKTLGKIFDRLQGVVIDNELKSIGVISIDPKNILLTFCPRSELTCCDRL